MSGGFFRGTSADQDTRFSNKQAKLLKTHKFPPELDQMVDMAKVKMDVIKPWIATRVTELLGFEDEVLINFIYGLLEGKDIDGKQIQIQLTGFMEKNTAKFMRELWGLLASAQKNASGVPQQFLDAKEEEIRKKKEESDRIMEEIQKKREKEKAEEELERKSKRADDSLIPQLNGEEREKDSVRHNKSPLRNRKSPLASRSRSNSPSRQDDKARRRSISPHRRRRYRSPSPFRRNTRRFRSPHFVPRRSSPSRRNSPPSPHFVPRRSRISPLSPDFVPRRSRKSPPSPDFIPRRSRKSPPSPDFVPGRSRKSPASPDFVPRRSPSPVERRRRPLPPPPSRRRSPPFQRKRSTSPYERPSQEEYRRKERRPPAQHITDADVAENSRKSTVRGRNVISSKISRVSPDGSKSPHFVPRRSPPQRKRSVSPYGSRSMRDRKVISTKNRQSTSPPNRRRNDSPDLSPDEEPAPRARKTEIARKPVHEQKESESPDERDNYGPKRKQKESFSPDIYDHDEDDYAPKRKSKDEIKTKESMKSKRNEIEEMEYGPGSLKKHKEKLDVVLSSDSEFETDKQHKGKRKQKKYEKYSDESSESQLSEEESRRREKKKYVKKEDKRERRDKKKSRNEKFRAEESESEEESERQKRLEVELREKALQSLRAKKGR